MAITKFLSAAAIVFFLSLEKVLVTAESVPTEAPSPAYSDYPVSLFPSNFYPESDKPFYEATCVETHKNVVDTLYDTFGRDNCVKNNPIEYVQTVKCEVFGSNYGGSATKSSAEYLGAYGAPYAFSGDCLVDYVPSALTMTYTNIDGSASTQKTLFFSRKDCGGCLSQQKDFLNSIRKSRQRGPPTSPSDQPAVSQMSSQSPTIDSIVVFAVTICTSDCYNAADTLNTDAKFQNRVGEILDPGIVVAVLVSEGSGICTPGCTVPSERRFLYPFKTGKDMSPVTSDDNEGRLLQLLQTTVVNIIVDMAETGESVNPTQLLELFEGNKSDLDQAGLTIEGVVLATQSPSSFPSSDDGTTTTPPNPAPYGIPTFPPVPPIPTLLPVASPSPAPTKPTPEPITQTPEPTTPSPTTKSMKSKSSKSKKKTGKGKRN